MPLPSLSRKDPAFRVEIKKYIVPALSLKPVARATAGPLFELECDRMIRDIAVNYCDHMDWAGLPYFSLSQVQPRNSYNQTDILNSVESLPSLKLAQIHR